MTLLIVGLLLFFGIHSVAMLAPQLRAAGVARLGEFGWKGLYSLIAAVGLVLMVIGYGEARFDPSWLYISPGWTRHLMMALMLPVFILLLAAYLPGRIQATLKHPMLDATLLWALAHLLVNGAVHDLLLFGSFFGWALAERITIKRRPARPVPALPGSPFNDVIAVVVGLILYAVVALGGHQLLSGIALI